MAGENLFLSYPGGNGRISYQVKCIQIQFGMTIITDEDSAALTKAMYTRQVQQNNFMIVTQHSSRLERDAFFDWCVAYGKYIGDWRHKDSGAPMVVLGPRNFLFQGILTKGIKQETQVKDVVWQMALQFEGAVPLNDPNIFTQSSFSNPGGDTQSIFFYPLGTQLTANQNAADSLFNDPNIVVDISSLPISDSLKTLIHGVS